MDIMFRIQEIILLLYFISLSALSYDLFTRNRQVRKASLYVMTPAVVLHIISVIQLGISLRRIPILTFSEGIFTLSLVLILIGIVHLYRVKSEFVFMFYLLITTFLLTFYTFSPLNFSSTALTLDVVNELLIVHVGSALLAYVMFFIAMVHSVIYLIQERNLKTKKFNRTFFSLFSIETAKKVMVRFSLIGVILLTISIIIGIVWGLQILGPLVFSDLKVIGTFVVIVIYGIILAQMRLNHDASKFAVYSTAAFVLVMLNYLVISEFSDFHLWSI
ncbi:cytochrome c biogenesis protein CcsA [Jeotgalicoccus sp. ATCC 8456]|uniref:cytochrome c biogenesis protein CcsA n=1 Tax=Jeotgalicoccus sp. ATCC 8456 TaxID=946435 RepID=UPI0018E64F33|nr:cytochrome c biogenesis protein CcsA [Jeotgalicoccus sp. ATCC 8456]QQD85312.1 cytochrome c biogenesis protein CcsA [Jeotgalicoccus sp. ATCC 8456]